jgi:tRNA(Ile)-lysidine synthase
MNPAEHFATIIERYQLHKKKLLLAVSGGMDSVAMAHLAKKAGLVFAIAHCNFQLRGEESEGDADLVASLAKAYDCPFHLERFDTKTAAAENKCGIQEAARMLRYNWFNRIGNEFQYHYTLTAHHADDNIETVLMNFFRGTGLKGLTGIPEANVSTVHIIRPLLAMRRSDLLQFARENELSWREDSSNASSDYTRNFFRNDLLPLVREVFPAAEENILRNIGRFKATNETYQQYVDKMKLELTEPMPTGEVRVPLKKLLLYKDSSIPFEIFREYGFNENQVEEIMRLSSSQSGKYVSNGQRQVIRHRNMLVIAHITKDSGVIAIDEQENERKFAGGRLVLQTIEAKDHQLTTDPKEAQLDAAEICWPLIVRRWRPGDYFYPLGLRKKKKLARFFIDQKLSKAEKENVWIVESAQRILWVVGHRIDDRFKVTPKTKNILRIKLQ